jgi:hypothetical protein
MENTCEDILRIENEICRLDKRIMAHDKFDDETTINLNGLVCLLRIAAWRNPVNFKVWLQSKTATINPTIMERFVLFDLNEDLSEKRRDGVQIRIHIFREPGDGAKHNHQRSFISMCIKGGYQYKLFHLEENDNGHEIEIWERIPNSDPPFRFQRKTKGNIYEVIYDNANGKPIRDSSTKVFKQGQAPLFVNSKWHHTVILDDDIELPVITVVARRGKPTTNTTFIKGPKDPNFKPAKREKTRIADEKEVERMYSDVALALTNGAICNSNDVGVSNLVSKLMLPKSKTIRISEHFLNKHPKSLVLKQFMELNRFTYIPVVDKNDKFKAMINRDLIEVKIKHDVEKLNRNTSIIDAILWTILSENFVVPIVDGDDNFLGLLSLFDIVNKVKTLSKELMWKVQESGIERKRFINICSDFIDSIMKLEKEASDSFYNSSKLYDEINQVLLPLGELVLNSDISSIQISEITEEHQTQEWLESIAKVAYRVDSEMDFSNQEFREFLEEVNRICNISQFISIDSDQQTYLVALEEKCKTPISPIDHTLQPNDVVKEIGDSSNWPLFVRNNDGHALIVSIDELFSKRSLPNLYPILKKVSSKKKTELNDILVESCNSHPEFTKQHFDSVPSIFASLKVLKNDD